eukprot:scaffold4347_cov269-Ochromonas_danica.AAC.18
MKCKPLRCASFGLADATDIQNMNFTPLDQGCSTIGYRGCWSPRRMWRYSQEFYKTQVLKD